MFVRNFVGTAEIVDEFNKLILHLKKKLISRATFVPLTQLFFAKDLKKSSGWCDAHREWHTYFFSS